MDYKKWRNDCSIAKDFEFRRQFKYLNVLKFSFITLRFIITLDDRLEKISFFHSGASHKWKHLTLSTSFQSNFEERHLSFKSPQTSKI